ncbi:MAG: peptidoglycan endopeptidase [Myxococcales bacterium]|nr:MAG: peptidoglycan endopeptidase [Myxococcales bacterium]
MAAFAAAWLTVSSAHASEAPAKAKASERILQRLERIAENLRESKYNHATVVDEKSGRYEFDCSGLVTWVLRRTAPGAHAALIARSARPVARDYYWAFARAPTDRAPRGLHKVARVSDAQPGDLVAWLKPAQVQSPNTGHVAFLLEQPRPIEGVPGGFLVRIADASSYQHDADDRYESGRTGFGTGTILLLADETSGEPRAYGWYGLRSRYVMETPIALGRITR